MKVGYVAVIGRPNVGKSTLVNALLKFKLSAISPKPQTTRYKILGIINEPNAQILILDTPGIFQKSMYALHDYMLKEVEESMRDADLILWVVEPQMPTELEEEIANKMKKSSKRTHVILVINKIDTVHKNALLPIMDSYSKLYEFVEYIPISALKRDGLDILLEKIKQYLPEGQPFYLEDEITDKPLRFIIAEIIREKVFIFYRQEIPYSTAVKVEEFKERENGIVYIRAVIYVERESQRGVLIGRDGKAIKKVGTEARKEIESLIGKRVYLDLWVKVKENWRENLSFIKELERGI